MRARSPPLVGARAGARSATVSKLSKPKVVNMGLPSTRSRGQVACQVPSHPGREITDWHGYCCDHDTGITLAPVDRKSTRLNSSHLVISYAVFCLKKKKKTRRCATMDHSDDATGA